MNTASVHWQGDMLRIYVTADHPVQVAEVVKLARSKATVFLGKSATAWRVGPKRRAMSFRRAYVYAFTAVPTTRGVIHDG